MNELIGNNIMTLRKQHGLTQEQLANALGISYQAVSKWETGNACPDISTLPLLADLFDVSVDQIIGRVPLMSIPEEPETQFTEDENVWIGQELPWPDDDSFYAVLYHGHSLIGHLKGDPDLEPAKKHFVFEWEGPAKDINSDFSVNVDGDVVGSVDAGGDVSCADVGDGVRAGGSVKCADVGDGVQAGGNVNCSDVGDSVRAGGSVCCRDVGENVSAGMSVQCGTVGGSVNSAVTGGISDKYSRQFDRFGESMACFGEDLGKRISAAVNQAMSFGMGNTDKDKE